MHPLSFWVWTTILLSVFAAKVASWMITRSRPNFFQFVFLSPALSTDSWRKRKPFSGVFLRNTLEKAAVFLGLTILAWKLYFALIPHLNADWVVQSYLALVPLYVMGQLLSLLLEILFASTGWHYPAHFQLPFLSKSLAEFWGRRWASSLADWLNQIIFSRYRRRPAFGLLVAFFYSGLWHEVLINVPLYAFHDVNRLGSQLIYFLIQAVGILGERKFIRFPSATLRRAYVWAVVILPAPLVVNEGVLRVTGLLSSE